MRVDDLDTPFLTADLDAVERNVERMQRYCDDHGLALRPHVKTHKLPRLARLQVDAGACGITCQKIGEAEVFADAGFDDILISFPIVGPQKVVRLEELAQRVRLTVAIDSVEAADAAAAAGVDVLVECDTGGGRTGVQTPEDAAALGANTRRFRGFMTYPFPAGADAFLRRAVGLARGADWVSVGGTPTAFAAHEGGVATELRVGTYVYGDRACLANGTVAVDDCALRVVATVVSTPTPMRAILDAGSKTLTSDMAAGATGYGLLVEHPGAEIVQLNEEHAIVDVSGCAERPRVGDRVSVIPNHACGATNLHDVVALHRSGDAVEVVPVAARGTIR